MIILLFLMMRGTIKTICLLQKKEQELYGLDEKDAFFTNLDIDTINVLYQKEKCESEMKMKNLMKFLNGR